MSLPEQTELPLHLLTVVLLVQAGSGSVSLSYWPSQTKANRKDSQWSQSQTVSPCFLKLRRSNEVPCPCLCRTRGLLLIMKQTRTPTLAPCEPHSRRPRRLPSELGTRTLSELHLMELSSQPTLEGHTTFAPPGRF